MWRAEAVGLPPHVLYECLVLDTLSSSLSSAVFNGDSVAVYSNVRVSLP